MEVKELICIGCPMGCQLRVTLKDGKPDEVTGNTCPRGAEYAVKELTDPRRIVTSTVKLTGSSHRCVPVKTKSDIPKAKIFDCMSAIKALTVETPVHAGDVVLANVVGTGVDVIAVKTIL